MCQDAIFGSRIEQYWLCGAGLIKISLKLLAIMQEDAFFNLRGFSRALCCFGKVATTSWSPARGKGHLSLRTISIIYRVPQQ